MRGLWIGGGLLLVFGIVTIILSFFVSTREDAITLLERHDPNKLSMPTLGQIYQISGNAISSTPTCSFKLPENLVEGGQRKITYTFYNVAGRAIPFLANLNSLMFGGVDGGVEINEENPFELIWSTTESHIPVFKGLMLKGGCEAELAALLKTQITTCTIASVLGSVDNPGNIYVVQFYQKCNVYCANPTSRTDDSTPKACGNLPKRVERPVIDNTPWRTALKITIGLVDYEKQ